MGSCKDVRCSGTELALWMVLSVAKLPVSEFCHKIFSGSSTMIGGFGSGWDLVLILREARFQIQNLERMTVVIVFGWLSSLGVLRMLVIFLKLNEG